MAAIPLQKVELHTDVYMVCLQHALSTENFEVMGLLVGNFFDGVVRISAVTILRRSDKKKDRVEISAEQIMTAATDAERLQAELNRPMQVLGWYHSHPHITVNPSHVDVRTQASYQTLDDNFVGLIFSVFTEGKESKEQEIFLTCFQSRGGEATEIPLEIVYTPELSGRCLKTMTSLPKTLVEEEDDIAKTCKDHPDILASIHNNAVRTRALVHVTDIITKPLILTFEKRIALNELRAAHLRTQLQELQKMCRG